MGLKGIFVGGCIGGLFGGPLGAVFGAAFGHQAEKRIKSGRRRGTGERRRTPGHRVRNPLAEAYAVLGARSTDTSDELVRKYRELAKRFHPDMLRAQSRPEAEIVAATDRMSRINAAWAEVRTARGI